MKTLPSILALALLFGRLAFAQAEDMVLRWNHVLNAIIRADATKPGPTWGSRNPALMHVAIFEAVNSITLHYQPFYETVPATPGASAEAAAAQAAYRILRHEYPAQEVVLGIHLADALESIAEPGRTAGIAVGEAAAELVLARRADDGSTNNAPYTPGTAPGQWRSDPLHPSQRALGANWGEVKPFSVTNGAQFRPPPPPALDSPEYAAAWDEVRRLGSRTSSERTTNQTEIGIFWGYDRSGLGPPPILYTQIAEAISRARNFSLEDNAWLFAMVTVAMADAGVTCWNAKYFYNFWRPVGGIREADTDGNASTTAEPAWEPLGAPGGGPPGDFTPPFPAYPSGHATFGAAVFRILELVCGTNEVEFTVNSDEMPGVTRDYTSFTHASEENARSRIYLGIHWNFDDVEGRALGQRVADHVYRRHFAPVLRLARHNGELDLVWPVNVKGYRLMQCTSLTVPDWKEMSVTPVPTDGTQQITMPMIGSYFFRLARTLP